MACGGGAGAGCVGIFLEKACKAQLAGQGAGFRASLPGRATREKRHSQIMTPVHWEHSWNYFCRKLAARGGTDEVLWELVAAGMKPDHVGYAAEFGGQLAPPT